MLAWFRRQRFIAALLIAANPALVGSWVAAYHPCPVKDGAQWRRGGEAQVVVAAEHSEHEGMMMGAETPPAPSHDHSNSNGPCTCIGQCLTAGIALPSVAGDEIRVAVEITSHAAPRTSHSPLPPASAPPYLLPPSTAPPTA
ncbi:MAG TPA: hypothetical protein VL295_02720 [Gemmatimonadales bacterium]|nr:hypothetical protein [Gemmatimonadales bacterium]